MGSHISILDEPLGGGYKYSCSDTIFVMSRCGRWRKAAVLTLLTFLVAATVLHAPPPNHESSLLEPETEGEDAPANTPVLTNYPPLPQIGTPRTRAPSDWSEDIMLTDESDEYWSSSPAIAVSGDCVHVAFKTRRGEVPTFYDYMRYCKSLDGGLSWEDVVDLRYVDSPLVGSSPDIAVSGDNVYVVWGDGKETSGEAVYINISRDGGDTWEGNFNLSSIGSWWSEHPHISVDGSRVVVLWSDDRDHISVST
ncbi:MAG: hypothetical protein KAT70_02795, partial [Thermoplasmata archaeon]|nr:hypothetical protein [Thermoplasmata archaeon]